MDCCVLGEMDVNGIDQAAIGQEVLSTLWAGDWQQVSCIFHHTFA